MKPIGFLSIVLLLICLLAPAAPAFAAAPVVYPTRGIDIIVPFAPGGSTDASARAMAAYLTRKWGVPVMVVNKPGGNTIPGTLEVYSATPDGYTMLADGLPMCSLLDVVVKDLPFKVMDRTFIAMTAMNPLVTIVPASSPFKTFDELVAYARDHTTELTWDSQGGVSGDDIAGRMVFSAIGVDPSKAKPVMSKGGSASAALVAGGHVVMGHPAVISALPHIQAGTVRPLAIALDHRDPTLPDVPTHGELGYPSVNCPFWLGVSGPPKLPEHIVKIWIEAIQDMLKDQEYNDAMKKMLFYPFYHGPKEMVEYINKERAVAEQIYK